MTKSEILNFNSFLNESSNYKGGRKYSGITERWDGGYDVAVCDTLLNGNVLRDDKINIARKTEKAVALAYVKPDGKVSDYIWIPAYACKKKPWVSSGSCYVVEIASYTNWFKDEENRKKLENFLNDFIDNLELREKNEVDQVLEQAKEDMDLILDQLGLNDAVASLERSGDKYHFDGITENGLNIVVNKRSLDDLIGEFKIYEKKDSSRPIIEFVLSKGQNKPVFYISLDGKVYTVTSALTEIETNPFLNYLVAKSLSRTTGDEEKKLVDYYIELLKRHDWSYQYSDDSRAYKMGQSSSDHINEVGNLLKGFMSPEEVSKIYSDYSKSN